jgi:ribosomal protein S18 acetylase RimI-like enzyme
MARIVPFAPGDAGAAGAVLARSHAEYPSFRHIFPEPALLAAPGSFRAFMKTGANGARVHPAYPHWYLETMGVDPAAQRMGLGGRLLRPVLEIADRDHMDCYLETAKRENVEYYARHGFAVEDSALQLVPDGPAHVAMRRRPVAATNPRS